MASRRRLNEDLSDTMSRALNFNFHEWIALRSPDEESLFGFLVPFEYSWNVLEIMSDTYSRISNAHYAIN